MEPEILKQRIEFHNYLVKNGILTLDAANIASNADSSSRISKGIAKGIAVRLGAKNSSKALGQTAGAKFEEAVMLFLKETFLKLSNLRPGKWHIEKLGNRNITKTHSFIQYSHLEYIENLMLSNKALATSLGNDYMIAPDIVIYREPEPDDFINQDLYLVNDDVANLTAIREKFNKLPILHASISAKWTMRSDRAQNSRTEALGLIRNRKGPLPHINVITGEPMPARLASLALGTGDIDCLYHFALYELIEAVKEYGAEDSIELLNVLIEGKRLKDISDLPMDLAL